jgi:hypothetical protein
MKRSNKRLVLDKQRLRTLTGEQLRAVEGGNDAAAGITGRLDCTNSWRPCCTGNEAQ